jgi:hypothetical protein
MRSYFDSNLCVEITVNFIECLLSSLALSFFGWVWHVSFLLEIELRALYLLGKQTLCHLNHTPSSLAFVVFQIASCAFCLECDPSFSISGILGIIDVYHHTWPCVF